MANKQINDLQLRSDADGTINIPCDDASQTWRVTGAQLKTYIQGAIAPLTTLGDILYAAASGVPTRLAGNTAAVRRRREFYQRNGWREYDFRNFHAVCSRRKPWT
jgi:hypothetical protein